jgi:oligoribonuclease NrnB/cAMP/cGMP phosphodiesterase (DHH superfamily)
MPTPVLVFYHADCLDGFGAAYAAWRHFGDGAEYRPMHYDQAWSVEDINGREVYILDASYPRQTLLDMATHVGSLTLLDHHASARDDWHDVLVHEPGNMLCIHRDSQLPLTVVFDMERSGTHLAWDWFHAAAPMPRALAHIEDQDLWRFRLPGTRAICRALRLRSFDFAVWDAVVRASDAAPGIQDNEAYQALLREGEAVGRFFDVELGRLSAGDAAGVVLPGEPIDALQSVDQGLPILQTLGTNFRAVPGLAINANPLFASELGSLLAEQSGSFGMVWHVDAKGQVKVSLRAAGKVDVAHMAAHYGGGGHPNAAGFRMPLSRFIREILPAE